MLKVAVLSSTNGTNLPALFSSELRDVSFGCLITNVQNCGAQQKANDFGVPSFFVSAKGKTREQWDREAILLLQKYRIDFVVLSGFMRILSPIFIRAFPRAIVNVHPSLLPSFAGGMDGDVHEAVLAKGCKISGATVHFVDEDLDSGPILLQNCVHIAYDETPLSLKHKVQKLEQKMLIKAVELYRDRQIEFIDSIVKVLD